MRRSRSLLLAFSAVSAVLAAGWLLAAGTELYGKPLRGLTPVSLAEVKQSPERHRDRTLRVVGTAGAASASEVTLSGDGAALVVRTDGSFSLPEKLQGTRIAAEGKLKGDELVATGLEVSR
jgi:hypothetical protein